MATDKYKIEKVENELILTIKHEKFANKVSGDKIKVTVKHNGYMDASGEITILDAVYNVTLNTNGGVLANESDNIINYTNCLVMEIMLPITKQNLSGYFIDITFPTSHSHPSSH